MKLSLLDININYAIRDLEAFAEETFCVKKFCLLLSLKMNKEKRKILLFLNVSHGPRYSDVG